MDSNIQNLMPTDFDAAVDPVPQLEAPTGASPSSPPSEIIGAIYDIPVKVQAVLGGARMQINELLQMRSGTVIELDRRVGEPVDVIVNDRLIARGELVLIDGSLGITLTEIVKQEQ